MTSGTIWGVIRGITPVLLAHSIIVPASVVWALHNVHNLFIMSNVHNPGIISEIMDFT
jgi:hypothetical protein